MVALFSVVNVQDHAVEIMPPQIQLGGKKKTGKIIRRSRWVNSEQLPIADFRLSRRRIGPGERADGVVVFYASAFQAIERNIVSTNGRVWGGGPTSTRSHWIWHQQPARGEP